jgi:hypothetical protein
MILDSNQVSQRKMRIKKTVALHYRFFFYFMDAMWLLLLLLT